MFVGLKFYFTAKPSSPGIVIAVVIEVMLETF